MAAAQALELSHCQNGGETDRPRPFRRAGRPALRRQRWDRQHSGGVNLERLIPRALRESPGRVALALLRAFQLLSAWRYFSGIRLRALAP